ncbi:MAG: hypothetical protein ACOCRO_04920 [Halanaerobiales bacterium]
MAVPLSILNDSPLTIISQYIPPKNWNEEARFIIYLTTCDDTYELDFYSLKEINMLIKALENLQFDNEEMKNSIQTFVIEQ